MIRSHLPTLSPTRENSNTEMISNDGLVSKAQGCDKRFRPCTRATALLPMNISFMIFLHPRNFRRYVA